MTMRRLAIAFYVVVALLSIASALMQPREAHALDAGSTALAERLAEAADQALSD